MQRKQGRRIRRGNRVSKARTEMSRNISIETVDEEPNDHAYFDGKLVRADDSSFKDSEIKSHESNEKLEKADNLKARRISSISEVSKRLLCETDQTFTLRFEHKKHFFLNYD